MYFTFLGNSTDKMQSRVGKYLGDKQYIRETNKVF